MSAVLLTLGFAAIITAAAATFIARSRESRALRDFAVRNRLNFTSEDLIDLHGRYYHLDCVRRGHNHFAWNLLYGTTEEGLVSLFCCRCDLGFGVNQISRTSWIVVVETPHEQPAWSAEAVNDGPSPPIVAGGRTVPAHAARIGSFIVYAEADETIARLQLVGLESFLADHPAIEQVEACRQFVAVVTPYDRNPEIPARLLDAARHLAHLSAQIFRHPT